MKNMTVKYHGFSEDELKPVIEYLNEQLKDTEGFNEWTSENKIKEVIRRHVTHGLGSYSELNIAVAFRPNKNYRPSIPDLSIGCSYSNEGEGPRPYYVAAVWWHDQGHFTFHT